jgi:hypothetical protein
MINGIYGQTITTFLSLEEARINTAVAQANIRYLAKFTNDLTKDIKYCYPTLSAKTDRSITLAIAHNTSENIFTGTLNFKPFGFWTYEIYEVSWIGSVALTSSTAPETETEVLAVDNANGVVQGVVHKGKMKIQETVGSEQIQYTQTTATETNYLYTD